MTQQDVAQAAGLVSIPWSGFRSFTDAGARGLVVRAVVSIPWSGFRSFTVLADRPAL